jgi:hypothetical protein
VLKIKALGMKPNATNPTDCKQIPPTNLNEESENMRNTSFEGSENMRNTSFENELSFQVTSRRSTTRKY